MPSTSLSLRAAAGMAPAERSQRAPLVVTLREDFDLALGAAEALAGRGTATPFQSPA